MKVARVSILLIAAALMAGMVGCVGGDGNNGDGSCTLIVDFTAGGTVTVDDVPIPGKAILTYDVGTVVSLNATPDAGYCFAEWTGNVSAVVDVYGASSTIMMNDDYCITANFLEVEFTDGLRTMYLDSGSVKVGVDKEWGGAIRELWYKGQNLVNSHDGGRLMGVSLYDGGDNYALDCNDPDWGWNPVPSDKYSHLNPPLTYSFEDGILYVAARNLEWNPDNKGGGPEFSVASEVIVETWIKFVHQDGRTIAVKYKITHEGVDDRTLTGQELPYVYVRTLFPFFVSYTGEAPWTGDPATLVAPPTAPPDAITAATENWGGFVNSQDEGLVLWSPQSYSEFLYVFHDAAGPENAVYYMRPVSFLEIGDGFSLEFQAYLFVGRWQDARQCIYDLNETLVFPDVLPCFGNVDTPADNAIVSGIVPVQGWAADNRKVDTVEILLDGVQVGLATYGSPRPDVEVVYPGLSGSPNFGFSYSLDTREYRDGAHVLKVRATDTSENRSYLTAGQIVIEVHNE